MISIMKALKVMQDVSLKCSGWEKGKLPNLAISENDQCSFYGIVFAHNRNKCHFTLATDISVFSSISAASLDPVRLLACQN